MIKGKRIKDIHKNIQEVKFPKKTEIVILKIHNTIIVRPTIKQCIKIEWRINDERFKKSKIILAVNQGKIEEIFELNKITKSKTGINRNILHVSKIMIKKQRNYYIGKLIPEFYRKQRHTYPVRYNYDIKKGVTIFY
jgi:hypothetical protein